MAEPLERPWTLDEFFAWQERQEERYELVNGFPLKMMAGAKNVHDRIVVNALSELRNQLRGSPCRPFTGDSAIETYPGQIRRPDVGVDCGRSDPEGYRAETPKLVLEVLSPSTRDFNTIGKLQEYKSVASLDYIVIVEPLEPLVRTWRRDGETWVESKATRLDEVVDLATLGVKLPLRELYDRVEFPPPGAPVRFLAEREVGA